MPFTISHAAAILPLARQLNRWRALSAAVIGSMVPDFTLLIPWHVTRFESHSREGLIAFCLPLGLACYWLFEYIVKPATREVLSDPAYVRSAAFALPDSIASIRQWLVAATGILLGGFTHLAWDGFTHEGARGVRMIPMLDDSLDIGGHSMLAFRVAQHVSSVVGLAIVLYILWSKMRPLHPMPEVMNRRLEKSERRFWMGAYVLCATLIAVLSFEIAWMYERYRHTAVFIIDSIAVAGLRGLLISLLGVSLLLRARLGAGRFDRPLGPS